MPNAQGIGADQEPAAHASTHGMVQIWILRTKPREDPLGQMVVLAPKDSHGQ